MPKILFIFTTSYPYGKGEQYLENELKYYSHLYEKIYFFPVSLKGEPRKIPDHAEVVNLHENVKFDKKKIGSVFKGFISDLKVERKNRKNKIPWSKLVPLFKSYYNAYFYALALNKWMENNIKEGAKVTLYSYWFYHWVLVFSLLKKKFSKYNIKTISRAHLGDVYDFYQYNLWAGVKLYSLNHLLCISEHAATYFKNNFFNTNVVAVSRLGIPTHSINPTDDNELGRYTIVSCSSIRKEKRIDFIVEVLKHCKQNIHWIHFGNGPLEQQIKDMAKSLPEHITFDFKGFTPNNEVLSFYENNKIDLFINLSSHEGIPVSIMEATSFGIPVLATNVFGTPEIVNATTGALVELEDSSQLVAKAIDSLLLKMTKENKIEILQFHKENFDAHKNYVEFSEKYIL